MKKLLPVLMLMVLVSVNLVAQIPTNGLIGYWPFNGNANDSTGNGYNGVVTGAVPTTDRYGVSSAAYQFNDSTQFITITDAAPLRLANTDFTVSFWVNQSTPLTTNAAVITKRDLGSQNGYIMNITGGTPAVPRYLNYQVSGGIDPKYHSDSTISMNTWHHITLVYKLSTQRLKIYRNGILNGDTTGMPSPNAATVANMVIGKDGLSGGYSFRGKIDDIAIYNRELSLNEIYQLFMPCSGAVDINNNIIAKYDFAGNALDNSGNNHNGTASNATLTTDRFGNTDHAYLFNGTSSTITVPDQPALRLNNTNFTISAWVFQNTPVTNYATILSKRTGAGQNGYVLNLNGPSAPIPGTLSFIVSGGADPKLVSDSVVTPGSWHHVAVVYTLSGGWLETFIDGNINNARTGMPTPNAATSVMMSIGNDGAASSSTINGKIDDLRIYNRALSLCDIDSLFNMPDPVVSGVHDIAMEAQINIYPNPARDHFTITNVQFADVIITNTIGQVVKYTTLNPSHTSISITELPTGIYFVNIETENHKTIVKKIVKY